MVSMQRTRDTEDFSKLFVSSRTAESAAESIGAAFSQSRRRRRRSASPTGFATARELLARVEKLEGEKGSRDAQFDNPVHSLVDRHCRNWLSAKAETELRIRDSSTWMEKVVTDVYSIGGVRAC